VAEDVPGGSIDVCFRSDSPSAKDYTVVVGVAPGISNPATRKS